VTVALKKLFLPDELRLDDEERKLIFESFSAASMSRKILIKTTILKYTKNKIC
jgi:hypothetical protein